MPLRRLRTDRVDLLYQHRIDPNVPVEDVAGLSQGSDPGWQGLAFGLSSVGAAAIRRAQAVQPLAAVENHYASWSRCVGSRCLDMEDIMNATIVSSLRAHPQAGAWHGRPISRTLGKLRVIGCAIMSFGGTNAPPGRAA